MKKIKSIYIFIGIFILMSFTPISEVKAESNQKHVVDDADLITDKQEETLTKRIDAVIKDYNVDFVIVTTNDTSGKNIENYTTEYYFDNGYGLGEKKDGILFVVAMDKRKYYTWVEGKAGKDITEYGIDCLCDAVEDKLKDKDYNDAFNSYIDVVEDHLQQAKTGKPYDKNNKYKSDDYIAKGVLITVGVSFLISLIAVLIMKASLNTARPKRAASDYIKEGSFNITRRADIYLHTSVTKRKLESSSDSGGSGRSHSSSSSGHGGGGSF